MFGKEDTLSECCASVCKESLSSLRSFSLGIFCNGFIYKCTSSSEWICSFALGSVSLNEFTKGKLNWNESFVAQTFLVSSKKFHPVVAKYITQFLFLLLFFILLFPIDFDGQVAFWAYFLPSCFYIGETKLMSFMTSQQWLCLFPVEMITPVLLQVTSFWPSILQGGFNVLLQIIVVCPLLIATVSCGNQSSWLMANWVEWAEKDVCFWSPLLYSESSL